MRREIQAYIAYSAGRLATDWSTTSLWDKDRDRAVQITDASSGLKLQEYPFRKGCKENKSRDGSNHCLVDAGKDQHVCLSVYGRLFDGYDHGSSCHFSGMINDDVVELYDYSESEFFRFEMV